MPRRDGVRPTNAKDNVRPEDVTWDILLQAFAWKNPRY